MSTEDICSKNLELDEKQKDKKRPANSPLNDREDTCTDFCHIREIGQDNVTF